MQKDRAYKIVAKENGISNSLAKSYIDRGLVTLNGKRVTIARSLHSVDTKFSLKALQEAKVVLEDKSILALNKPPFITSQELEAIYNLKLLHRLDKGTSGILILCKSEEFRKRAIDEFRAKNVYKEYIAYVDGIVKESMNINEPIKVFKGRFARAKVDKSGKEAQTKIEPIALLSKKHTKIRVVIKTGITHQIRVHLKYINYPILGDEFYGGTAYKRVMLHSKNIKLFDYNISVDEPYEFKALEKSFI